MRRAATGEAHVGRPRLSPRKKLQPRTLLLPPVQWEAIDSIVAEFNEANPDEHLNWTELVRQFLDWAIAEYREESRPQGEVLTKKPARGGKR